MKKLRSLISFARVIHANGTDLEELVGVKGFEPSTPTSRRFFLSRPQMTEYASVCVKGGVGIGGFMALSRAGVPAGNVPWSTYSFPLAYAFRKPRLDFRFDPAYGARCKLDGLREAAFHL
jgi:hypothetical protein